MENQTLPQQPTQQQTQINTSSPMSNVNTQPSLKPHTPKWIVMVLIIFFQPLAWYFIWREKYYHSWFPTLLAIFAIFPLLTLGAALLFVVPTLTKFYETANIQNPHPPYAFPIIYTIIVFLIGEIIFAFYLNRKVKRDGELSKTLLIITIILLAFNLILTSFSGAVLNALKPIHNVLNAL